MTKKQNYYFLAQDLGEAVRVGKENKIHYSDVQYIRDAGQLAKLAGKTLIQCPGFLQRPDAPQIIEAARFRRCEIIKPERLAGSRMVVSHG